MTYLHLKIYVALKKKKTRSSMNKFLILCFRRRRKKQQLTHKRIVTILHNIA